MTDTIIQRMQDEFDIYFSTNPWSDTVEFHLGDEAYDEYEDHVMTSWAGALQPGGPGNVIELSYFGIPVKHNPSIDVDGITIQINLIKNNVKKPEKKCECGSDKIKSDFHSPYCPKFKGE